MMGDGFWSMKSTLQELYLGAKRQRDALRRQGQDAKRDAQINTANKEMASLQEQYKSLVGVYCPF